MKYIFNILLILFLFSFSHLQANESAKQINEIKIEVRLVEHSEYGKAVSFGEKVLLSNVDFNGAEAISRNLTKREQYFVNAIKDTMQISKEVIELRLKFTKDGQKRFYQISKKYVGEKLGIFIDGKCLSSPKIIEPINSDTMVFYGDFTKEEIQDIADRINAMN